MDEADILADTKAILAHGRVRCVGTSLHLKMRFGLGYILTIIKNDRTTGGALIAELAALVQRFIQDAQLSRDVGLEVVFRLPLKTSAKFAALFEALDERKRAGVIADYSMSMTTLEEVFLRLENDASILDVDVGSSEKLSEVKKEKKTESLTYSKVHVDMKTDYAAGTKIAIFRP